METITINRTVYQIVERKLIADMLSTPRLQVELFKAGIMAQLLVKRPKGSKHWLVYEHTDGRYNIVTAL